MNDRHVIFIEKRDGKVIPVVEGWNLQHDIHTHVEYYEGSEIALICRYKASGEYSHEVVYGVTDASYLAGY